MKILDISLTLSLDLPVWPGDPKVSLERYRALVRGDRSNDTRLTCSVHTGTHVDAPLHVMDNGPGVADLCLDKLMGPATVGDLTDAEVVGRKELEALKLAPGTKRLLLKTRNSEFWSNPTHEFSPDFVALSPGGAEWVVKKGLFLIGIDYLSIQRFSEAGGATHQRLLKAGVIVLEGLSLKNVIPGSYQLICLPLKLAESDGAPARAILVR
jgi:arylformamidase